MARETHVVKSRQEHPQHEGRSLSEQAGTMSVFCFVSIRCNAGALVHGFFRLGSLLHR